MNENGRLQFSGYGLKILAALCMTIDHLAIALMMTGVLSASDEMYEVMRIIGRMAFPIFCFLIAEGNEKTSSRFDYFMRLLLFAFLSEPFFDFFLCEGKAHQNVLFTLAVGEGVIWGISSIKEKAAAACKNQNSNGQGVQSGLHLPAGAFLIEILLCALSVFAGCALAEIAGFDYGGGGVLLIVLFYAFYLNKNMNKRAALIIICVVMGLLWCFSPIQFTAIACIILLIPRYNGERGKQERPLLFYAYYPLLLFLLGAGVRLFVSISRFCLLK